MKNEVFDKYFGGKNGSGVAQQIINQIRPHDVYFELFGGSGAVMQIKKPARLLSAINEKDPAVYQHWQKWLDEQADARWKFPNFYIWNKCGIELLYNWTYRDFDPQYRFCLYLDPPYPLASRRSDKPVFSYEMTDQQHIDLLNLVRMLPSNVDVLISTYQNPIYQEILADWRLHTFQAQTRQGPATEYLYMNYENPTGVLHQYDMLGENYTDRQRIKRKVSREVQKLQALPATERQAIISAITDIA